MLSSLIAGELATARHLSALDPIFVDLDPATEIGRGELATDSLDLLTLAAAVSEMFHLHETGVEEYLLRYRTLENWCEIVATSLKKKAERITFRTSGSTGIPKRCVHLFQQLEQEAFEHAAALNDCRRVLSMVPSHHIYGFIWTALVPAQLRLPTLNASRWSPSRIADELRKGDLLVGVPSHWHLLSRILDLLPAGVFGVTSGAACAPPLFDRIKSAGVQLVEVYGSSETAGIGIRRDAADPFALLSVWSRGDSESNAADNTLLRTSNFANRTERVQTPDQLIWENDRLFRVGARQDGAVQIAGRNVFPARIEKIIRTHPAIQTCAIRPMLPEEGNRLKGFVVWRDDCSEADCSEMQRSEPALRRWLETKLQPFEQPASFTFGPFLPVNEINKLADWPVR